MTLTIDGREVTVAEGTTIWEAAKDIGVEIPVLCHDERYDPVGVCRMCVVDIGGARARRRRACGRARTAWRSRRTPTRSSASARCSRELLLVDQPPPEEDPKETTTADNELLVLVHRYGVGQDDLPRGPRARRGLLQPGDRGQPRRLHPLRPLRARVRRHPGQRRDRPLGQGLRDAHRVRPRTTRWASRSCVTCGECVAACPTGALVNKPIHDVPIRPRDGARRRSTRVCPYCGVGCALTYHVDARAQRDRLRRRAASSRATTAGCA